MTLRDAFIFKIEILFIYKRIMSVSLIDFYGPIKIIFVIIKSNKPKTQLLSSARKLLRSKINVRDRRGISNGIVYICVYINSFRKEPFNLLTFQIVYVIYKS